jgi:hypothetical protein
MSEALVPTADPVRASIDHLLALSFLRSTSPSYELAASIARGAAGYHEGMVGKQLAHVVVFAKTRDDAVRAQAVLRHLEGVKSLQVFTGGKVQSVHTVLEVLDCFLVATGCRDHTAHCHEVIDSPFQRPARRAGGSLTIRLVEEKEPDEKPSPVDRYLFPCSFLLRRFHLQHDHPAKPADLVQAGGVKAGCAWCPLFEADCFRKVGTVIAAEGRSIFIPED